MVWYSGLLIKILNPGLNEKLMSRTFQAQIENHLFSTKSIKSEYHRGPYWAQYSYIHYSPKSYFTELALYTDIALMVKGKTSQTTQQFGEWAKNES